MGADQLKKLKDLERENARLKKAVADPTLDKLLGVRQPVGEVSRWNRHPVTVR